MKDLLIVWASIMTVALVVSMVMWHPWNLPQPPAPPGDNATSQQQLWEDLYNTGYEAGYKTGALPETIERWAWLLESKLVKRTTIHLCVVLGGTLTEFSVADRTIILQADGDNLTIYLRPDVQLFRWSAAKGDIE